MSGNYEQSALLIQLIISRSVLECASPLALYISAILYQTILSSVEKLTFDNAGAPDLQQAKPVSKQPMCEHMGDADSCKDGDAGAVKSEFSNRTRYKAQEALRTPKRFAKSKSE